MVMPREKLRIMPVDVRRSAGALLEELERNGVLEWDIAKKVAPCVFPLSEDGDAIHLACPVGRNGVYSIRYETELGDTPLELCIQARSLNVRTLVRCARLLPHYSWRANCPKGHYIQTRNLGSSGYEGALAEARRLSEMPL